MRAKTRQDVGCDKGHLGAGVSDPINVYFHLKIQVAFIPRLTFIWYLSVVPLSGKLNLFELFYNNAVIYEENPQVTLIQHPAIMFLGDVRCVSSLKIDQAVAQTPLSISSHPIVQERTLLINPVLLTVGCFRPCVLVCACVFYLGGYTYACCPCPIYSSGHIEGVWIGV